MQEYVGITANLYIVETNEGKPLAQSEVALIVSEPHYPTDGEGGFEIARANKELRFSTSQKGLDSLIKQLTTIQSACQSLQERVTFEPTNEE